MKRIGLISDTHGYFDEAIARHFEKCDEIWHAGDFGSLDVVQQLRAVKPLQGVYGNIDGNDFFKQKGSAYLYSTLAVIPAGMRRVYGKRSFPTKPTCSSAVIPTF